ncbi:MAG: hypothetical protein IJ120_08970 [Solobacterium sp.]|nr:hypothetical protein [Solobacterium sp.]
MKKQRLKPQVQYLILLAGITVICLIIRYCFPVGYDLDSLKNYGKTKHAEEIPVCASSSIKTYEDYRMITDETSDQYRLIHTVMKKDRVTGLLYDPDGFIGVALGYQFGPVGTRYYFDLDTGITLPVIKIDAKDPADASDGCKVDINGSVLEFVIDSRRAAKYFGTASNGLVLQGNFNSHPSFEGNIAHIERITEEQE